MIQLPSLKGLPRQFVVLWVGMFINRLGGFVVPFLAIYLTSIRHFSVEFVGFVAASLGAGILAGGLIGGYLADRIGRRSTLLVALCAGAAAMLLLWLVRDRWLLIIVAFLVGLFGDMYKPAAFAAVADIIPPADRLRTFGLIYWAVNLATSIAMAAAGFIAAYGFGLLFVLDAATTLIYAFVVWRYLPESKPNGLESSSVLSIDAPLRNSLFCAFIFLTLLTSIIYLQSTITLPLDMQAHGLTASQFGFLMALNGVLVLVLQPFSIQPLSSLSPYKVLRFSAITLGVGFGLHSVASATPFYAIGVTIWTVGEIIGFGVIPTVVSQVAPPTLRGSYQGLYHTSWGVAALAAPMIGTFVLARFGRVTLWIGCFLLSLIVATGYSIVTKRLALNTQRL